MNAEGEKNRDGCFLKKKNNNTCARAVVCLFSTGDNKRIYGRGHSRETRNNFVFLLTKTIYYLQPYIIRPSTVGAMMRPRRRRIINNNKKTVLKTKTSSLCFFLLSRPLTNKRLFSFIITLRTMETARDDFFFFCFSSRRSTQKERKV